MKLFAFIAALNAFTAIILGFIVLYKKPTHRKNQTFFLFCLFIFLWSLCYFFWQLSSTPEKALFWVKGLMFAVVLIPAFFYHYTVSLLNKTDKKWLLYLAYILCIGLALANLSDLIVTGVSPKFGFPYWGNIGPLFHLHLVIFAGVVFYSLYLLSRAALVAEGVLKQQLLYSIMATALGFGGGMTNYFLWYNIPIKPYGSILVNAYTGLLAYAILKYRFLDITVIIRKTLIYSVVMVTLTAIYLGFVTMFARIFAGLTGYQTIFSSAIAALLITSCFQPLRKRVQGFIDSKFFRQYVDREEKLYELSREVITHTTPEAMAQSLIRVLGDTLHPKSTAIYLRARDGDGFVLASEQGNGNLPERVIENNPLNNYFMDHPQPFVQQDLPADMGEPLDTRRPTRSEEAA